MQPNTDYTVKFLKIIVFPFAITFNSNWSKYENAYVIAYYLTILIPNSLGQLWAILTWESFIYRLDATIYATVAFSIAFGLLANYRKRDQFIALYNKFSHHDDYFDETFFRRSDKILREKGVHLLCIVVLTLTMASIFPVIVACFADVKIGSAPTLLYPSAYPWTIESIYSYTFTILLQIVICIPPLFAYGGMIIFAFYVHVLITSLYVMLNSKIIEMNRISQEYIKLLEIGKISCSKRALLQTEFDKIMLIEIRHIFHLHQFLTKFVNTTINLMTPTLYVATIQFFTLSIFLTSSLILVNGNTLYQLKMLNAQIIVFIFFIINCYLGEWLSHMNDLVMNQIYETEWYWQSLQFRKEMALFMTLLKKPFKTRLFGSNFASLALLTNAIKNIYSVVQVILRYQNNRKWKKI